MTLKGRLDRLELTRSPAKQPYAGAKELLVERFERADPETRERVIRGISEQVERAAE